MADRYWSPAGAANWADANVWATTDGGNPTGIATPTSSDDVFFTSTNVNNCTIGATADCLSLDFTGGTGYTGTLAGSSALNVYGSLALDTVMTNNYTGTLSYKATAGTITISSDGVAMMGDVYFNGAGGTFQLSDNMTISKVGAQIRLSNGTFDGNGQTVILDGGGATVVRGSFVFADFTYTGGASKTGAVSVFNSFTCSGVLTINGNSATNRVLIESNVIGTARTLTAATVVVTNADFQDITGAGLGDWDISAGSTGDCGGNTDIIFTTADTMYWHVDAGSWSDDGQWFLATNGGGGAGRVPLPQDDAVFDANSFDNGGQTVSGDMPRPGKSINWTGATDSPTWATAVDPLSIYGSLTLIAAMTYTHGNDRLYVSGRDSYTMTTAGHTIYEIRMYAPGGTLTLQDGFTGTAGQTLGIYNGTLDANNQNLSIGKLYSGSGGAIVMGSGTWTLVDAGTVWNNDGSITCEASTIKLTDASADNKTFAGNGETYNNIWLTGGGSGDYIFSDSNIFNDFKVDTPPHEIIIEASTTITVTTWTGSGTDGNPITLRSSTTTNATLAKAGGGVISLDWMDVDYISGSPATTWYMGANSVDGTHNVQIYFTVPPSGNIKSFNGVLWANIKTINGVAIANIKAINGVTI